VRTAASIGVVPTERLETVQEYAQAKAESSVAVAVK